MKKLSDRDMYFIKPKDNHPDRVLLSHDLGALISSDGHRLHALKYEEAPVNCTVEITTYGDMLLAGDENQFPPLDLALAPHTVLEGIAIPCSQIADAIDPNRKAPIVLRIVLAIGKDGLYHKALEIISEDRYALIMGMGGDVEDGYGSNVEMWKPIKRSPLTVKELNSLADADKE